MSDEAHKLALHNGHVEAGATMVVRDGWWLPETYGDVDAEVAAVRAKVGVFDRSHLGRIRIQGDGALDLLEQVCTADVARQEDDTALLTDIRDEAGGVIDTGFLLRLEPFWVFTSNAAAREAVVERFSSPADSLGAKVDDQTFKTSMLTVAGPGAPELLDAFLPEKVSALPRRAARMGMMMIARYIAMRTGSTGLWSLEVMVPNMLVGEAWRHITQKASGYGLPLIGTAAQDILQAQARLA